MSTHNQCFRNRHILSENPKSLSPHHIFISFTIPFILKRRWLDWKLSSSLDLKIEKTILKDESWNLLYVKRKLLKIMDPIFLPFKLTLSLLLFLYHEHSVQILTKHCELYLCPPWITKMSRLRKLPTCSLWQRMGTSLNLTRECRQTGSVTACCTCRTRCDPYWACVCVEYQRFWFPQAKLKQFCCK